MHYVAIEVKPRLRRYGMADCCFYGRSRLQESRRDSMTLCGQAGLSSGLFADFAIEQNG